MGNETGNFYAAPLAAYEVEDGENTSGMGKFYPAPPEVAGWSWGAFFFSWIWAIGNRTWIGLLALFPYLGFIMAIVLGVKGREWAWQNKRWDSIEHFNRVQRLWSIWAACLVLGFGGLGIVAAIAIPAYSDYVGRGRTNEAYLYSQRVAANVGDYIKENHALPADLAAADVSNQFPEAIANIVLNQDTAQLEITMGRGGLQGKAFYLSPSADKDGNISWRCLHGEIRQSVLPKECRYSAADPFHL
ncbi:pilin [Pseudoduganella violaceinigra]|uniref:pilin n=1 Tax=Pseudoduganella violaceinigra TaxID=246602 RepID=UPI001B7F9F87|nr:pilin [Pseudoduganella violaceinigra]